MSLINLKTNLKDLKFGRDQYKDGSSSEPYVTVPIPDNEDALRIGYDITGNNLNQGLGTIAASAGAGAAIGAILGPVGAIAGSVIGAGIGTAGAISTQDFKVNGFRNKSSGTGGPDFLLRGGTLLPSAIINDEIRLAKFFTSWKGLGFTLKQNLLSRLSVSTQASPKLINGGVYTPISTLLGAIGTPFGIHVNKQGLNPLASTGLYSDNESLYGVRVTSNQTQVENRLVDLFVTKISRPTSTFSGDRVKYLKNNISDDPNIIFSYSGGPGAELGIGKTQIRIASNPINKFDPRKSFNDPSINYLVLSYSDLNTYNSFIIENTPTLTNTTNFSTVEISNDFATLDNFRNNKNYIPSQFQKDFRKQLLEDITRNGGITTLMSTAPPYEVGGGKRIEERVNLGDPGRATNKNLYSYTRGYQPSGSDPNAIGYGAASENSYDKINASIIYKSVGPDGTNFPDPNARHNDLVKFRIAVIDNKDPNEKKYIHFRAFLNGITDSYNANWEPTRYIGRGENFYTYSGFDRKVSLSWTVAAQSKAELIPMYRRLNYLASVCAPNYGTKGYMGGNIVQLTIGGYFYEQPGIITAISYEMNDDDASWELGINEDASDSDNTVKELPHLIKVNNFEFIPIHRFAPQIQNLSFNKTTNEVNGYGDQKYIALSAKFGSDNYSNVPFST